METNKHFENKIHIFAIFIRGEAKFYDFFNYHDQFLNYLNDIARKGGTNNAKLHNSFIGLNEELKRIAYSIDQKYGLKYQYSNE